MNLKIFAELNKDTLNEYQRKLIEDIENLLHNTIELDRYYGVGINELTDDFVDVRVGTSKGLLWVKLINDGVFCYKYIGYCKMNPPANLNDPKSLERFKKYVGEL